jgi:hydroxypyruvate reductase
MNVVTPFPLRADAEIAPRGELLRELFSAAVRAVSPEVALAASLPPPARGKTLIVAIGKAAASMAHVAQARMGERVETIVLTRYGHGVEAAGAGAWTYFEAGHPIPDEAGMQAAAFIRSAVEALGPDDLLLALVSGGGSALLTAPPAGVTLEDLQELTRHLLACGAPISQFNCVRKHLSTIQGGRLAVAAAPARVVTLALSDIPGDDPALIASGPTLPDRTTLADARQVLAHYGVPAAPAILRALEDPANETPRADAPGLANGRWRIAARNMSALSAAGQLAAGHGYTPIYLGDDIEGESVDVATVHAALALHHIRKGGRYALISGGETTVVVRNREGRGGRNTEYLLALALGLDGAPGVSALACDTDGIDGTEDNAGAVIDPTTLARARALGLSPAAMLQDNLAHPFFEQLGDLVITGPTRTNVNDVRIILVDA